MLSYSLQCGLQRGYLSSYRFMLSFRDIYITLSSLGVPALVLGRQSCRDPSHSLFHLAPFLYSSSPPERNETVMIVTAQRAHVVTALKQNGMWLAECGRSRTWRGPPRWLSGSAKAGRMSSQVLMPTHLILSIWFNKHTIELFTMWRLRRLLERENYHLCECIGTLEHQLSVTLYTVIYIPPVCRASCMFWTDLQRILTYSKHVEPWSKTIRASLLLMLWWCQIDFWQPASRVLVIHMHRLRATKHGKQNSWIFMEWKGDL